MELQGEVLVLKFIQPGGCRARGNPLQGIVGKLFAAAEGGDHALLQAGELLLGQGAGVGAISAPGLHFLAKQRF